MACSQIVLLCFLSDRQHEAAVKSVDRLIKDLERTNSQMGVILDDISNVEIVHDSKQRELSRQQETCFTDETAIKVCDISVAGTALKLTAVAF